METVNKITDVLRAVSIIYSDKFKEPELAQLVKLVQKISLSYLKYQELMGRKLRQYSITDSNELQDLALDCIAGLFIRNSKGEFIQLKKYFGDSAEDFHRLSENEVLVLLKRLVVKKTKQELCRIFKEREPEKAKILRNIKLSIKTTSDFHSFKDAGREYLCFNAGRERMLNSSDRKVMEVKRARFELESNDHSRVKPDYVEKGQPEIPDGILLQEYLSLFHPRDTVPTCIRKMLTIVKDDQRYRDYLPLDTAAKIIHRTNIELVHYKLRSQYSELSPLDHLQLKEIEGCKRLVSMKIRKKIENQYVRSDKISEKKGETYCKALADVLDDIGHGKKIESYFKYLRRYIPSLTQKKYRQQERTIFEYLGKVMKNWLRKSLQEFL